MNERMMMGQALQAPRGLNGPVEPRSGVISGQLRDLNDTVQQLEKITEELGGQLMPIMRVGDAKGVAVDPRTCAPDDLLPPMGEALRGNRRRINEVISRINMIMERVEL